MKLSVIVPVYRVEQTLDRCLKSIVSQNYDDMEVILVDDGSPDRCPRMCDKWAQRNSRIQVVHKENGGLSDARNAGLEKAQGEYVTFVDSDDYVGLDTYRQLMELLAENPNVNLLEYPVYWHYGTREQRVLNFGNKIYTDSTLYWLKGYAYEHTYAWNKIYRRTLFEGVRFPKGQVFEDVATLPLILQKQPCVATTSKGLYHYCWNKKGITATATGSELQQLLNHHINILNTWNVFDRRYYMHILNIQLDVCELTGEEPQLPALFVGLFTRGVSFKQRLKSYILFLIGIKNLCKLNRFIHQQLRGRS
jgi:glycosyltransferase involved in cell wall biosynthesis